METQVAAYRWASAIARLAWIQQYGFARVSQREGQTYVEVIFHTQGPFCTCCGKAIPRQEWLIRIIGNSIPELQQLLDKDIANHNNPPQTID